MVDNAKAAPLEDLMAAMDVVDTLRHQQDIAVRELDDEGRRQRLLERLRELYAAQGIEVPDHVLQEGINALEEERFQYQAVPSSWRTKLAHIWVSRSRWSKPVGFLTVLGGLFSGVYFVSDVLPERQLKSELPTQIESVVSEISQSANDPSIVEQSRREANAAKAALQEDRLDDAQSTLADMRRVAELLSTEYSVRIVARPGEKSGVWRVPEVNQTARNYYLIVEAVDNSNKVVELDILDEETNQQKRVATWGLRVNEETFYKVATDKRDDGIIQNNQIGRKPVGTLTPKFSIPTTGGAITRW